MGYLGSLNLPPDLFSRLELYYSYLWERNRWVLGCSIDLIIFRGVEWTVLYDSLPPSFRTEVSFFINKPLLEKVNWSCILISFQVPLFEGCDETFHRMLSTMMRPALLVLCWI